jgi:hypothetical protein
VDAFKIVTEMKRPVPMGAEDIGTWFTILEIMATCGVVSNSLLVCFTSKEFTEGWSTAAKVPSQHSAQHALITAYTHNSICISLSLPLSSSLSHPLIKTIIKTNVLSRLVCVCVCSPPLCVKVWAFVILEHAILSIRYLFELLVDDTPPDVSLQLGRQEFLVDKIIKLAADDDDDDEIGGAADDEEITIYTDFKATHVAITTSAAGAAKLLNTGAASSANPAQDKAVALSSLSDSLEAAATGPKKTDEAQAGAAKAADVKKA